MLYIYDIHDWVKKNKILKFQYKELKNFFKKYGYETLKAKGYKKLCCAKSNWKKAGIATLTAAK